MWEERIMDICNQRDFAYLPWPPFFRGQWATLKATQGGGIKSILKGSAVLSLCRIWQTHPGDPARPGSGPGQQLSAMKCCLPENNVFKMVIAGHVGLSRDRSWPRLLTRSSCRLPVSAASVLSGSRREQEVHLRSFSDLGPGKALRV